MRCLLCRIISSSKQLQYNYPRKDIRQWSRRIFTGPGLIIRISIRKLYCILIVIIQIINPKKSGFYFFSFVSWIFNFVISPLRTLLPLPKIKKIYEAPFLHRSARITTFVSLLLLLKNSHLIQYRLRPSPLHIVGYSEVLKFALWTRWSGRDRNIINEWNRSTKIYLHYYIWNWTT